MPVTNTATITNVYTLIYWCADMKAQTGTARFSQTQNGVEVQIFEVDIAGADLQTLLNGSPTAGMNRGDDTTIAIYNLAIAKGIITGAVS